jgi:hypothetical protein
LAEEMRLGVADFMAALASSPSAPVRWLTRRPAACRSGGGAVQRRGEVRRRRARVRRAGRARYIGAHGLSCTARMPRKAGGGAVLVSQTGTPWPWRRAHMGFGGPGYWAGADWVGVDRACGRAKLGCKLSWAERTTREQRSPGSINKLPDFWGSRR